MGELNFNVLQESTLRSDYTVHSEDAELDLQPTLFQQFMGELNREEESEEEEEDDKPKKQLKRMTVTTMTKRKMIRKTQIQAVLIQVVAPQTLIEVVVLAPMPFCLSVFSWRPCQFAHRARA